MVSNTSAVTCYSLNKISAADSPHSKDDADQLVACNPGSVNSTCCYAWETCAPDLLCYNSGEGSVARQYCTDPTWTTDQCSKLCPGNQPPPLLRTTTTTTNWSRTDWSFVTQAPTPPAPASPHAPTAVTAAVPTTLSAVRRAPARRSTAPTASSSPKASPPAHRFPPQPSQNPPAPAPPPLTTHPPRPPPQPVSPPRTPPLLPRATTADLSSQVPKLASQSAASRLRLSLLCSCSFSAESVGSERVSCCRRTRPQARVTTVSLSGTKVDRRGSSSSRCRCRR
ncbi:MAG: hypothetical protein LQ348_006459 [Seirophora lacunosa]|nr:MAG: hypothetical protein LQ348_006459 [Seirophora lacunosa]